MPAGLILAIDQGTTNTKALLVDQTGFPVFRASRPLSLHNSQDGFVEQDPQEIWQSVVDVAEEAAQFAHSANRQFKAIAISNQRETALAWDRTSGQAVGPAISWQCTRGASICDRLTGHADVIRRKAGVPLAPLISATKWAWLLEQDSHAQQLAAEERLKIGTVDTWLVHQLTQGAVHATDLTNASRTGLLNLATLQWDPTLLELFGLSSVSLPELRPSSGDFGRCATPASLAGVPILSAIGDSHAAMFGHSAFAQGTIKATYGTGSSLMALTPALAADTPALSRTIAWAIGNTTQFAIEGNITMTGSAIQWLGEFLALSRPTEDVAALAAQCAEAEGVYFVPAMVGLGAPHWDPAARGTVTGLSRFHTREHLARATLDAIAYQVADVYFAIEEAVGIQLTELRADGGATRNSELMQFQADILGRPVRRSFNEELSALGAARLAGLSLGWWTSLSQLESLAPALDAFIPNMNDQRREQLYAGWRRALRAARTHEAG